LKVEENSLWTFNAGTEQMRRNVLPTNDKESGDRGDVAKWNKKKGDNERHGGRSSAKRGA